MPTDLVAIIKEKQEAIAKLQEELDAAEALLTGKTRPRPHVAPSAPATPPAKPKKPRRAAKAKRARALRRPARAVKAERPEIVSTSSVGRTVAVLRRAGKPLHVDEIIKQIEAEGAQVNKTTLVGNLSRYVKAKLVFYRAEPSVFGLAEMRKG